MTVEYIDPEKKPALAQQYGVTALGTVVFEYAGRNEKATSDGEQELTNALIKVVQGRQPKVYFVQGHGEKDTTSADRTGYNSISAALTSDNFVVDKVVLAQQTAVPADADVLVIAGPRTDFLAPEIDMLKAYLAQGGKLLIMLDPVLKPDQPQLTGLEALLKDWGIAGGPRHRARRQRHGPPDRHRRVRAGRRQLSEPSDHAELQPADGLPARAIDDAD